MDKTLLKGLMVLEAITDPVDQPRTIDELAERVGLARSNAHRTLQTLIHAGYVTKNEAGSGYRGSIRLFELAARQLACLDVRKVAGPAMQALADSTGETVHLSVLDGLDVVYVEKIESPQPIRAYSMVGGRAPAYAVATGKALLAHQKDGYLDRFAHQIFSHTKATITSLPLLKEELRSVIRLGYAVNSGEWRDGVGGVAVGIFNSLNQTVAAVGISGPLERLNPKRIKEFVPKVIDCANQISRLLGYQVDHLRTPEKSSDA